MKIRSGVLWTVIMFLFGTMAGITTWATPPFPATDMIRVRFSEPAASAAHLFAELSRRTGVRLECAPEVCEEILLLHVQDVPLRQIMARIAEVTNARWRLMGRSWRLERPAAWAEAERVGEERRRAAQIAPLLAHQIAALRKPWNPATLRAALPRRKNVESTGQIDIDHLDPVWRAFLRCLSDVAPEEIARIPVGGRIVFATDPTSRQRPLGKGAREALTKLMPEQALFGATLRSAGIKDGFEDGAPSAFANHDVWQRLSPYPQTPVRVLLSMENKWTDSYEMQLTLLDNRAHAVVEMRIRGDQLPLYVSGPEPPQTTGGAIVPLSHRSRVLLSVVPATKSSDLFRRVVPRLSAEARTLLTHPERYEPLGMATSDGYLALAKKKNRNLIAALPDNLLRVTFLNPNDRAWTLTDVRQWPRFGSSMHIADRGGWLIVTPPASFAARSERVNRAALGWVARRVAERGGFRIEDLADLAAHGGGDAMSDFGDDYLWALSQGDFFGYVNAPLLALYGALTDEQRHELLAGKPLPYGILNPRQRTLAEKAVYGSRYAEGFQSAGDKAPPELGDLVDEPTQCCANGLLPRMNLRANRKRKTLIYFWGPGKTEEERIFWRMDAETPTIMYDGPLLHVPRAGFDVVRYQLRRQNSLTIEADVTPWSRMYSEYDEAIEPPTGPLLTFSELPADIQKGVKEEMKWLRFLTGGRPTKAGEVTPRLVPVKSED